MSAILNPQRVQAVLQDCLFRAGEDKNQFVEAKGINCNFGFHPTRLENHRQDVVEMLGELPDAFRSNSGGGFTFLNAFMDRHGEQWTGDHAAVDYLLTLGIALEEAAFCLPREAWGVFPGGMPYFMVRQ